MSNFSLDAGKIELLRNVVSPFANSIDRVALFGSYALGRAKPNSDIDLVIFGTLSPQEIDRLWTLFEDSDLPVPVDVIAYTDTMYPPLRHHIDSVATTLFTRADIA